MPSPKFNIGDEVVTSKIGPPAIGIVWGIFDASDYCQCYGSKDRYGFDPHYPNWRDSYIYRVKFGQPIKPMTLETFIEINNNLLNQFLAGSKDIGEIDREKLVQAYKYDLPPKQYLTYPEEDLQSR